MYQYSIDDDNCVVNNNDIITSGPPATAFLNQLPEVIMDLRRKGARGRLDSSSSPLLVRALEFDLISYFIIPVFYHRQTSCCVGVVECCLELSCLFKIFMEVKRALKSVGFSTFNVQDCRPYKSIPALKRIADEIKEALIVVCESYDLPAAQVWIPYENKNHVPFKSCRGDGTQTTPRFAVKLIGYCVDDDVLDGYDADDLLSSIKSYYDTCDTLPLDIEEEGLVGKTLETYEPHFCRNIYDLDRYERKKDMKLLGFLSATTRCSSFVICLRSIDTGDIDYAFEFLWPQHRNCMILLESLVLTLRRCLPHFKYASGLQLGDELLVIDVESFRGSGGLSSFKIIQGNCLSPIPKALEERRSLLVADDCISSSSSSLEVTNIISLFNQQIGRSMNETARSLTGCWQRPNFLKKKLTDVYESDSDLTEEEDKRRANQDDIIKGEQRPNFLKRKLTDLYESDSTEEDKRRANQDNIITIEIEYAGDVFKFNLPLSSTTIALVNKEIKERCNLDPGTYKLKYLDHDHEWILMKSDKNLKHCITYCNFVNDIYIILRVLPLTP